MFAVFRGPKLDKVSVPMAMLSGVTKERLLVLCVYESRTKIS
jgi:hypothetical protein